MSKPAKLPPWRPFTTRQLEIRAAIVELRRNHKRAPTLGEVSRHVGAASHSYIGRVVHKLKVRGEYP